MSGAQLSLSFVLPVRNEEAALPGLLAKLRDLYPDAEIIVVDDGSTDGSAGVCGSLDINLIRHPYNKGNGAAVKTGARAAAGDFIVFMDADGQHEPSDIKKLLEKLEHGYDMVVGARGKKSHAGQGRRFANTLYNGMASWIVGQEIDDLTSGFRAVNAEKFRRFLYLLPNGFSYPTTISIAFFRAGYSVSYVYVPVQARIGKSHIRPLRDGLKFLLIIFKVGTLYSPFKFFLPVSAAFFCMGFGHYIFTYVTEQRFTNMSALLFVTSVLVFLIGLVSEQVTMLNYKDSNE